MLILFCFDTASVPSVCQERNNTGKETLHLQECHSFLNILTTLFGIVMHLKQKKGVKGYIFPFPCVQCTICGTSRSGSTFLLPKSSQDMYVLDRSSQCAAFSTAGWAAGGGYVEGSTRLNHICRLFPCCWETAQLVNPVCIRDCRCVVHLWNWFPSLLSGLHAHEATLQCGWCV